MKVGDRVRNHLYDIYGTIIEIHPKSKTYKYLVRYDDAMEEDTDYYSIHEIEPATKLHKALE